MAFQWLKRLMESLWDTLSNTNRDDTHSNNEDNGQQLETREQHGHLNGQLDAIDIDQNEDDYMKVEHTCRASDSQQLYSILALQALQVMPSFSTLHACNIEKLGMGQEMKLLYSIAKSRHALQSEPNR